MTAVVIVLIIVLILVVKFFIDRDKMLKKQVDKQGGMKQKYKVLIEELCQNRKPEWCEITRDHLHFRFVGDPTILNYYITEQFSKVKLEWNLQMGSFGNKKLEWNFPESFPQNEVWDRIGPDVEREMKKINLLGI